ncbi:LETM1 domain-containing protein mdm28, mitochondrial [Fusarium culmorum]|uniref:LETM1 domain-containing protein mdm28, mitochondrial n=1 Tax=Fusarium culmorum TaxID=5516 RepID=A0A2T4GDS4_FUSCU|nr:LETM1 domain-containing protein mdm28, mitochondrial [Fusarium culmorum]
MSASSIVARRAIARNPFMGNARALSRGVTPAVLGRHLWPTPGFNAEQAKKPLPKDSTIVAKKEDKKLDKTVNGSAILKPADAAASPNAINQEVVATNEGVMEKADAAQKAKEEKKLTLWEKVKKEAHHYWDGSKLLVAEVKISWRLALKMAAGYELTRRENKQLQRTVQDLGTSALALKLFPNMLPSTFEGQKSKEAKATILRSTRKEVSEFLRQTLGEGLPLSQATTQKEEFSNFFRKVRATGETPTAQDVIKICKAFRDDLTLDNLSRPQLVSMCKYMNLSTFGTDMMLRYQIRHRMRQIKRDDKAISYEGVDSLTVSELQAACAARGIRTHSVSPARMRNDLQTWLDLRLKEGVPSTLLVLSNAYMYGQGSGEGSGQVEALIGVMSAIPEELYHEIELEVHSAEGAATNKQRLEVIREQQELIEDEAEQDQASQSSGFATPRDTDDIDEKEERLAQAQAEGLGRKQVSEMVEAETELAKAAESARLLEREIQASSGSSKEQK